MLAGNALCRATSGRDQKRAFKDQWVLRRIKVICRGFLRLLSFRQLRFLSVKPSKNFEFR
jgi:transposase